MHTGVRIPPPRPAEVAQLARARACQVRGCRFETDLPHYIAGTVLLMHTRSFQGRASGLNPGSRTRGCSSNWQSGSFASCLLRVRVPPPPPRVAQRLKGLGRPTHNIGSVAQSVERWTSNPKACGFDHCLPKLYDGSHQYNHKK